MADARDPYQVLGLARDATDDQVYAAWKKAAKATHPDLNKAPDAESRFKEARRAYEVLCDVDQRAALDRPAPPPPPPPPAPPPPAAPAWTAGGSSPFTRGGPRPRVRYEDVPRVPVTAFGGLVVRRDFYAEHQAGLEASYGWLGYWTRGGVPRWVGGRWVGG